MATNGSSLVEAPTEYLNSLPQNTRYSVTLPSSLLDDNTRYTLSLKITNFLGLSSTVSKDFSVIAADVTPRVFVQFPSGSSLTRDQEIIVSTTAKLDTCDSSATLVLQEKYGWRMFNDIEFNSSIVSTSLNPRIFKLPPYTLDPGMRYRLQSQVKFQYRLGEAVEEVIGKDSIIFDVGYAGIRACISGSSRITMGIGDRLELDASSSYSIDYPDDALHFQYSWECVEIFPNYGGICALFAKSLSQPFLSVTFSQLNPEERDYNFTVNVLDGRGNFDSASVTVSVLLQNSMPVVSAYLSDTNAEGIVNAGKGIVVDGFIRRASSSSSLLSAYWDCDQISDLAPIAKTPTTLEGISYTGSLISFPLVVQTSSLPEGQYLFRLTSTDIDAQAGAEVQVSSSTFLATPQYLAICNDFQ